MTNSFTFDGYVLRPITERDRPYLQLQINADEYHRDTITPDFFMQPEPGEESFALEDESGRVVFYLKTGIAVRLAIQFTAYEDVTRKVENRAALMKGLRWIEGVFRAKRFREIIFDTEGVELANFAKRRLGFVDAPRLLSKPLTTMQATETQPSELASLTTTTPEAGRSGNVRHE